MPAARLLPLVLLAGCASTDDAIDPTLPPLDPPGRSDARPGGTLYATTNDDPAIQPIGFLLSDLDRKIQAWNTFKLDRREHDTVEHSLSDHLQYVTRLRRDDIVHELAAGPPRNRAIAAMALGFTGDREAQGPLTAALDDQHAEVVANALLALGLLGFPDTVLDPICTLLESSTDSWTRHNAAYALQRIVAAGARGERASVAARLGLFDAEAGVRVPCALTLGLVVDTDSIDRLGGLLEDDAALVAAAAASSLRRIGTKSLPHKGACARALAGSLERIESPALRAHVESELVALAQKNFGDEPAEWRTWASTLP